MIHLYLHYSLENANVRAQEDAALKDAADNGHERVVDVLCRYGADVYAWQDHALRESASLRCFRFSLL